MSMLYTVYLEVMVGMCLFSHAIIKSLCYLLFTVYIRYLQLRSSALFTVNNNKTLELLREYLANERSSLYIDKPAFSILRDSSPQFIYSSGNSKLVKVLSACLFV